MEEELSENELEGRMYAMLHYVDETQTNVSLDQKDTKIVDNVQHSGLRRYWHNNIEQNTPYQKINTPKEPVKVPEAKNVLDNSLQNQNEESKSSSPDLSIFQQPVPNNIRKTVEILENEDLNRVFELESSDEDEVIEVALPPKPTITIESSDEDTVSISIGSAEKKAVEKHQESKTGNRDVTSSPVPSVVSSVSDEFIRGDCIALNISSKHANNQSFDFSLHGADLLGLALAPSRKKKKKRNKDTSTPNTTPVNSTPISVDGCFATPKSKEKNKRQKTKSYRVSEKCVPNPDVYDSDSNQSTNEGNKYPNPFAVPDKSSPNTDVCESDQLNQSEAVNDTPKVDSVNKEAETTSSTESSITTTPKTTKQNADMSNTKENTLNKSVIDLTDPDNTNITINENIVMGNVSGFTDIDSYDEDTPVQNHPVCGSTKIPAILNEDLDFDNLKGNNRVCKRRRYSLTTLRAEMEKFYNESWGGEDFNHREIQKNMSRDKSLWVIDPKDRMSSLTKRKSTCNYCNRVGHRDDTCRMKPPVCFMCGSTGHFEPRCPKKICVNCGSPNRMYSTMCRNCCHWHTLRCAECGQNGHPASHCPDLWRRYHNTINLDMPLQENHQVKKHYQIFCSGCTRRGHLVHNCRVTLPFSGLPINSPYVAVYRPVFSPICHYDSSQNNPNQGEKQYKRNVLHDPNISSESTPRNNDRLKRPSKSPVNHDTHLNKKKNLGTPDNTEIHQRAKSPVNNNNSLQKKNAQNKEQAAITNKDTTAEPNKNTKTAPTEENQIANKAPDFIPITSENHDKKGQVIQDNEVSDTSDVVTSARIYIPKEIVEKLKTEEGNTWLKEAIKNNNVTLESDIITFYLSIKGTVGNQEAFQTELRDWIAAKQNKERPVSESEAEVTQESITEQSPMCNDIPKNRNNILRKLNQAFETLKTDLGEPKALYRELVYLQNQHEQLMKVKAISPQKLSNSRSNINLMLRKLNMVLIGQAGLAGGSRHLTELHHLQEKLTNFRQKNIPTTLREEIGQHFHCIFTAIQRDDYVDLLNKYYYSSPAPALKRRHNNKNLKRPIVTPKNTIDIQHLQQRVNNANDDNRQFNTTLQNPLIAKTKRKLMFYHKRLLSTKPRDAVLKKTRLELINKINSQITSFEKKSHASKKNFKKMRKVQEQVQLFLSNICNI